MSEEDKFLWLSRESLKGETESEIITPQGRALETKYHATKILQTESDIRCRLCQQSDKKIDHIIPACPVLANEQDRPVRRHD
jgi:hypothetical protein